MQYPKLLRLVRQTIVDKSNLHNRINNGRFLVKEKYFSEAGMDELLYANLQDTIKKERCLSAYIKSGKAR